MGLELLKTVRKGGYDKSDCLTVIDALNMRMLMLDAAIRDKESGRPYRIPPETPLPPLKMAKRGGFECSDVDAYISEFKDKIQEMENKLSGY